MLQHDITNDKYYHNGIEVTAEEYVELYNIWKTLPSPEPEPYDLTEEASPEDVADALGGIL